MQVCVWKIDIVWLISYYSNIICCVYAVSQCGSNTQLLHVFQEDFILGYKPHEDIPDFNITSFPTAEGTKDILLLLKYGLHSFYRI